MIYRLNGELIEKNASAVVIDIAGVAYEATVSLTTYAMLPAVGAKASLYTYMAVREDGVSLFGFASLDEKRLFLLLISVTNIGPKLAVKILGGIGIDDLRRAIASSDMALLSSIPGVGKKTAERIFVELKDKVGDVAFGAMPHSSGKAVDDVIGALMNLGYKQADCKKAVEGASADDDFETVLKRALQALSGK